MPPKSNKIDKQKPWYEDKHSEGEEMSNAMSLMEENIEEEGEASNSGEKTNNIMTAVISLKSGLYKKIDIVQLTITDVKKQVQECMGHIAHAEQRISDAEDNVNVL